MQPPQTLVGQLKSALLMWPGWSTTRTASPPHRRRVHQTLQRSARAGEASRLGPLIASTYTDEPRPALRVDALEQLAFPLMGRGYPSEIEQRGPMTDPCANHPMDLAKSYPDAPPVDSAQARLPRNRTDAPQRKGISPTDRSLWQPDGYSPSGSAWPMMLLEVASRMTGAPMRIQDLGGRKRRHRQPRREGRVRSARRRQSS
jgi:hypothetical protein